MPRSNRNTSKIAFSKRGKKTRAAAAAAGWPTAAVAALRLRIDSVISCRLVALVDWWRARVYVFVFTVPPDILDYPTSTDMMVREGSNVTLRCAAKGTPEPTVTWRREAGDTIILPNGHKGNYYTVSYSFFSSSVTLFMSFFLVV